MEKSKSGEVSELELRTMGVGDGQMSFLVVHELLKSVNEEGVCVCVCREAVSVSKSFRAGAMYNLPTSFPERQVVSHLKRGRKERKARRGTCRPRFSQLKFQNESLGVLQWATWNQDPVSPSPPTQASHLPCVVRMCLLMSFKHSFP